MLKQKSRSSTKISSPCYSQSYMYDANKLAPQLYCLKIVSVLRSALFYGLHCLPDRDWRGTPATYWAWGGVQFLGVKNCNLFFSAIGVRGLLFRRTNRGRAYDCSFVDADPLLLPPCRRAKLSFPTWPPRLLSLRGRVPGRRDMCPPSRRRRPAQRLRSSSQHFRTEAATTVIRRPLTRRLFKAPKREPKGSEWERLEVALLRCSVLVWGIRAVSLLESYFYAWSCSRKDLTRKSNASIIRLQVLLLIEEGKLHLFEWKSLLKCPGENRLF